MTTRTKTITSKSYIGIGKTSNVVTILVKNGSAFYEVIGVSNYMITNRLNEMSQFSFSFIAINPTLRSYIVEFAEVFFMYGSTLFLKGRIQKVAYISNYDAVVSGWGMEAVLFDKQFVKNNDARVSYDTATNTNTIAKEILSTNSDGLTPWDMEATNSATIATFGTLQMRFESAYKLNSLSYLADVINQDWWVSHSANPYANDYFNIAVRGTTPGFTFKYTGSGANCNVSEKQTDVSGIVNYFHCLGYGDGQNQLNTSCYNMSSVYSTLNSEITSSSATITLVDATNFASSGTIRIMEEQVTYSGKSGNDLTGCLRGQNSTTAREHKKGCYVEKHTSWTTREELKSNADANKISEGAGNSISDYGIQEHTETNRTFRDLATMELLASNYLIDHKDSYVRIKLQANNPVTALASVGLGDTVTTQDGTTGLSGDYRVVSMSITGGYGMSYLDIELSNKSLALIEQLQKIANLSEQEGTYMLGSTNIYQVGYAENCDATHYFNLRFYMPSDAIAVNDVKINFKLEDFRAYEQSSVSVNSESDVVVVSQQTSDAADITSNWADVLSTSIDANCQLVTVKIYVAENSSALTDWYARLRIGSTYYPDSSGIKFGTSPLFDTEYKTGLSTNSGGSHNHGAPSSYEYLLSSDGCLNWTHCASATADSSPSTHTHTIPNHQHDLHGGCYATTLFIPKNVNGSTVYLQLKHTDTGYSFSTLTRAHFEAHARHTHTMSFGIYEETLTSPSVDVYAGDDGSETLVGTYTANQTNIDISNNIGSLEGWKNIQFRPNKRMRLDCSAYVKLFIESR